MTLKITDMMLIARALVLLSCVLDGERSDKALDLANKFRIKGQELNDKAPDQDAWVEI